MTNVDAFILIGGRSMRLGQDKAFAALGGQTLAERAANVAQIALSPKRITFVAGAENQFAGTLLFGLGHPVVFDLKPGFGAWSGLDTALGYALGEWAFVLACDLPFVTPELVNLLASTISADVDAVVPQQPDGRLQPLCVIYRSAAARKAVGEIFTGRTMLPPLVTLFESLKTRIVHPDEYTDFSGAERFFENVNTDADLNAART